MSDKISEQTNKTKKYINLKCGLVNCANIQEQSRIKQII